MIVKGNYSFKFITHLVVAWLSGCMLVSINEVTLRRAQLLLLGRWPSAGG